MPASAPGPSWRYLLAGLYLAALGLLVYLAWEGRSYYLTPLIERPRHPDYWSLKPGGSRGIVYGIVGASLMVIMLAYSLRKRWRPLRNWGALRYWLDLHILCGVMGPLFIVLHSSFKVQGLVALSFWSMVAVAASGVLGRYLYLQIPRAATGDRMTLKEVEEERTRLGDLLEQGDIVPTDVVEQLNRLLGDGRRRRNLLGLLFLLPWDRWKLNRGLRAWSRSVDLPSGPEARLWLQTARRKLRLESRLQILAEVQSLFHYWHVIHKPFALVMYIFMIVHIVVATMTGYVPGLGG